MLEQPVDSGHGLHRRDWCRNFCTNEQAAYYGNCFWCQARLRFGSVGLGARDTLRLEKGYLLSGQDFLWPGLGIQPDESLPRDFSRTAETAVHLDSI